MTLENARDTPDSQATTPFEASLRWRTLNYVLLVLFIAATALLLYNLQFGSIFSLVSLGLLDSLCLVSFGLNSRGHYRFAAILCIVASLLAVNFNVYDGYGLFDSGVVAYPIFIILGAMLLGRRTVPWLSIAALASLGLITYLQWSGLISVRAKAEKIGGVLPLSILTLIAGLLVSAIMGAMERSLGQLRRAESELRVANGSLEARVNQREAELRELQGRLIEDEKLATLGRVTAAVAHEMNSPIAAMVSMSGSTEESLAQLQKSLTVLVSQSTQEEREAFLALLNARQTYPPGSERDARKLALAEVERWGFADAPALADLLLGFRVPVTQENAQRIAVAVTTTAGRASADVLFRMADLEEASLVIRDAALKQSRVVDSLRASLLAGNPTSRVELDLAGEGGAAVKGFVSRQRTETDVSFTSRGNVVVEGNSGRLGLVWLNLLKNAVEAAGPSGRVSVEVIPLATTARVEVRDSGPGIPIENHSQIFKPFFTTRSLGTGLGLGLTTANRVVLDHGGTISFSSEPGETRFWVDLPLAAKNGKVP